MNALFALPARAALAAACLALAACTPTQQAQRTPAARPAPSPAPAAHGSHDADHLMVTPADVRWSPGPPSLPPGARAMAVEGNPAEAGPFTLRLWFPAGYRIAPHSHPAVEHITVISGTFYMGLGETFDRAAMRALPAGSFAMMNTGTRHFARTDEETVVQLHGMGPWGITYVNPADDPRNATSD
ncbi:MAG TPA: cupin domain-containing protein [Rubricoccaceae bacterium]|nr:cupin domain-containing protein [Rubricoccaceae bacterium]